MLKRSLSVPLFLIGGISFISGINDELTTISSLVLMREHIKPAGLVNSLENITRIVFEVVTDPILLIGVLFTTAGSFAWNWKRWRMSFGSAQLFVGCYSALAFIMALSTPPKIFFEAPPEGCDGTVIRFGYGIFSVMAFVIGSLLVVQQKRRDPKK